MELKAEFKALYISAFSDDGEFCEPLFEYCYEEIEYTLLCGKVASMLFSLPCEIAEINARYIFAAATDKEFRGRGYMSRLLEKVKAKNELLFLRPATKELISFYKKLGFKEITAALSGEDIPVLKPKGSFLKLAEKTEPDSEKEYPFMYYSKNGLKFDKIKFEYSMD